MYEFSLVVHKHQKHFLPDNIQLSDIFSLFSNISRIIVLREVHPEEDSQKIISSQGLEIILIDTLNSIAKMLTTPEEITYQIIIHTNYGDF